jgi:hypothetical protein
MARPYGHIDPVEFLGVAGISVDLRGAAIDLQCRLAISVGSIAYIWSVKNIRSINLLTSHLKALVVADEGPEMGGEDRSKA